MQQNGTVVQGYGRILPGMGYFHVDVEVRSLPDADPPLVVRAMVDTGSEYTWLPAALLESLGVMRRDGIWFTTATGEQVARPSGYAFLTVGGRQTVDTVVFADPGDATLLGAHTLEGLNVYVDPAGKRLLPGGPLPVPANIVLGRVP